mgnify:CR=1 FL=1
MGLLDQVRLATAPLSKRVEMPSVAHVKCERERELQDRGGRGVSAARKNDVESHRAETEGARFEVRTHWLAQLAMPPVGLGAMRDQL